MAEQQESSFRVLALNYRVNQEYSWKGFGSWQSEFICNLTRYNSKWKEDLSGRETGEWVKYRHIQ